MVNIKNLSQHSRNLIKTLFRALELNAKRFISVTFYKKTFALILLILISYYGISPASTSAGNSKKLIPERKTIAVFPTKASSVDWKNLGAIGAQDLLDFSLLQNFNKENSVYLNADTTELDSNSQPVVGDMVPANEDSKLIEEPKVEFLDGATEEVLDDSELVVPGADEVDIDESTVESLVPTEFNDEVIEAPTPEAPISYINSAVGSFLLAQAEFVEPVLAPTEDAPVVADDVTDENSIISDDTAIIPVDLEEIIEIEEPVIEPVIDLESLPETVIETNNLNYSRHSLTLAGFGIPKLESGHFIDNLQLRLSLAGQYEGFDPATLSIDYSFGEFTNSAGTILLEGEFSNAINGGYYLVPLPSISDSELLNNLEITINFEGEIDKLKSLFIDSAWLELDTVVYDKELLKQRTAIDKLVHLKGLEKMDFLSDELDFTREENPVFSLRYNSQRNFLVRTFRQLFSDEFATVDHVTFIRNGDGIIGVDPDINITADGLISIVLSDADKAALKPGVYRVEVAVDEGGYVSTDMFEFQWGLLSINTNQTEYTNGDIVKVSMGALSPNGNTVCDANLSLFVTDPKGYISSTPVVESGKCEGNNVVDVPDYSTEFIVDEFGEYELYLERTDEFGEIIAHTYQKFTVVPNQKIVIERDGPTRIFPPAPYAMKLTVHTFNSSFSGELVEQVPNDFKIKNTDAEIRRVNNITELVWNLDIINGGSKTVSYEFDAPDLSPFLFELGPAKLVEIGNQSTQNPEEIEVVVPIESEVNVEASTTVADNQIIEAATTITENLANNPITPVDLIINDVNTGSIVFAESRQWQIASDATGNMVLFWDGAGAIPSGWTCVSCSGGQTFFQNFAMGGNTYNTTGGAATHTHTATGVVNQSSLATSNNAGATGATVGHTHTFTPTISAVSNLPLYRQLRVIQYTSAAGEPAVIPAGAIGIFDVASSSLPSGWSRYAAQDGYYIRGENTPGTTGGANTHSHTITGTTGAAAGTISNGSGATQAASAHTHTVSSSTPSINGEPPYIEVLLAKIGADAAAPNNLIAMWTDAVPTDWVDVSSLSTDPFNGRFLKASTTYGATSGTSTHTHANVTGIVSSAPSATTNNAAGTAGASGVHTHLVDVNSFSTSNNLPPYLTAIFGKRANFNTYYTQLSSRWYVNTDSVTPTDPWPAGATNLIETESITATSTPLKSGDVVRLRINATVSNYAAATGSQFKLQYGAGDTCSAIVSWTDVGTSTSAELWRGYNNTTPADHTTLASNLLSASDVSETYEENGYATGTPNTISIGNEGEWDFVLQQNGASAGTNYCFRMVESDGTPFLGYTSYPKLLTNQAPGTSTLVTTFDNEKNPSTQPSFSFYATDADGDAIEYELVIDNDYNFSSPILTKQSSNYPTDAGWSAATFTSGSTTSYTIQPIDALTDGNTYWWKVRSRDPNGSNNWSVYSEVRSFTVDTTLAEKAWYQTLGFQFERGTLTGAATTTGGVEIDFAAAGTPTVKATTSSGFGGVTAGNDPVLTVPASAVEGDYMVVIFMTDDNNPAQTITPPANETWTLQESGSMPIDGTAAASPPAAWIYTKLVSADDEANAGSKTYTWADSVGTEEQIAFLILLENVGAWGQFNTNLLTGNRTTIDAPSVTTTEDDEIVFHAAFKDAGVIFTGVPSGTNLVNQPWGATNGAGAALSVVSQVYPTPGATGVKTFTHASFPSNGFTFSLTPNAGSATIMSPEIDFSLVPGQSTWGLVEWDVTEPAGTDSLMRVYYSSSTACDTIIPDLALPGNSTGFDVSDSGFFINSLSTTTYNQICLQMNLSVISTTTSPTLNSWGVRWVIPDQAPYAPSLAEIPAFDSIKSTSTTPTLGGFAATDYESDLMEYELTIDDDYNFSSPVLTKQSSNYPTDAGWSAATFTAGATTTYTIQPANALTEGTTYYWKVRARDPGGSNTWGDYSSIRSITISNSVSYPEWFETTDVQFNSSSTFSNATTTGTGGVEIDSSYVAIELLDAWSTGATKTVSSGSDRLLVVAVISEDAGLNSNVNTVTYGGQTLTQIDDQQIGTGFSNGAWVGYLDEIGIQAATNTNIVPTWVGGTPGNGILYTSATFENVNQNDPIRANSSNALTSGQNIFPAAAIDTIAGDMMVYITESTVGANHTAATGYTEGTEQSTGGSGFDAASAYKAITVDGSEYPEAIWDITGNRLLMVAFDLQPSPAVGSIMSAEVDFDWVQNQSDWGEVTWNINEPTGSASLMRVYYSSSTACDTIVPDGALTGNSAGFVSGGSPVDISALSTSTYNRICLQAELDKGTAASSPILTDWTISWELSPVYEQSGYWWFNNTNAITPTDTWPIGATGSELTESSPIVAAYPTETGDVLRLRMGVGVSSVNATASSFKLQYAAGTVCSESLDWVDVAPVGSTTAVWRGYNNSSVSDGATLPTAKLAGTDVLETYEEGNNTAIIPNNINAGQYGEWDWVLENGAPSGTAYCFRMVTPDGNRFKTYTNYPALVTNQSPTVATIDTPFDNEKLSDLTPVFEFTGVDPETNSIDYEIQVDNDYDFSSPVVDHNSITNFSYFENIITISDKSPFNDSETIRYSIPTTLSDGTTYWWRVRAKDTDNSNNYGDWSTARSFTTDTTVTLTTWFQTTEEQFDTNTLVGIDATAADLMTIAGGYTVGTTTSSAIDFDYVTSGNAWGTFTFNETGAANDILYHIEYLNGATWELVPDGDLAGNSTGFDTSPVDLIDLDTETYNQIRIRANFLNGSPTVTDWTVTWGERVSVPTHLSLFDNEKTDITTPTFTFYSTDLQGDDLQYEISYSTDYTFASGSTTANSLGGAGFVNLTNGGDTNPFTSGDTISYTVQSALTDNVTYYWRVRAKDPAGGDSYSFWSDPWSFTIASSATTSTWFQTTEEQFNTDTMVSLQATSTDNVSTVPAGVNTYDFSGITLGSGPHQARDFRVNVNDPTDPPLNNDIDTLTTNGTTAGSPNLYSGIAGFGADTEASTAEYTALTTSDDSRMTITDPGGTNNAVFWAEFLATEDPANISQIDILVEGYQAAAVDAAWLGIWRPGSTTPHWEELDHFQQAGSDANFTGTITGNFDEYFDGNNKLHIIFFNEDRSNSLFVDYAEVVITTNTADSGTITATPIDFDDGSGPAWGQMTWNDSEPGGSSIYYQLEYLNGIGQWELIPNSALAGNSTGFTTAPVDLKYLNTTTYNQIRPVGNLSCNGASCPTLNDWTVEWSRGFTISGTAYEYDGVSSTTAGTVAVAVNGVLQIGKTGTISNGTWTIDNVTYFSGDVVTVFVSGAADADEAVAITKYDGVPDITGMRLQKRHLSIGSNDNASITNVNIGTYDTNDDEDLFYSVSVGNDLTMCADVDCADAGLYILTNNTYAPTAAADLVAHDFINYGTVTLSNNTWRLSGSYDNNATTTFGASTVIMTATSSSETIDSTGASSASLNNLTLGETSGTATWTLNSPLTVSGNLLVTYGTLARDNQPIYVARTLTTAANGYWSGMGTTTLDGINPATITDNNATDQNIGRVVIDGTTKAVTLGSSALVQSILIGANDTLDANNFNLVVNESWLNQNTFTPRTGTVTFVATSTGKTITNNGSSFYNLTFNGANGAWSFTEPNVSISNNLTIATGTLTLSTGTTTVAGSFDATGGAFAHNNGTLAFIAGTAKTITFAGGAFSNTAYNLYFNGAGSWTITDTNATSSNDVVVKQGTINFPSGVMAIGGSLNDTGGTYAGGTGKVLFYSSAAEILTAGGSSFNDVEFSGSGSWSFSDSNAAALGDLIVTQGTLTMPTGTFTIGGSYSNLATVTAGSGTVSFNSTDTGETINFGSSALYDVNFNSVTGGWTITAPATTTHNLSLTNLSDWTLNSGQILAVGGTFTNSVGGAGTTWTGSTLNLYSGTAYSANTSTTTGDTYNLLNIAANTDVKIWNSSATIYAIDATGSLYSQDHAAVNGDLYIWGDYQNTGGSEYWSYATDFNGTTLSGGNERQVDVRLASNAKVTVTNGGFNVLGGSSASTTIDNQGSGTYTVDVVGGTTTARYYDFGSLGSTGVSFLSGAIVSVLRDGAYEVTAPAGTALTLSSTTIDANPGKQIYGVTFSTSTAIAAYNVTQTDGTPASYWWFRESVGNLQGEANDNDTGDPGSVRWDDSSLTITISGTVYSDAGITPLVGGTCDGSTPVVRVVVNGGTSYTGSCSNVDGTFSIGGVAIIGDPTLTVYLDNATDNGSVITRTPTGDITDLDIYANRVIVRNEDVAPTTIENLAVYDFDNDNDLQFVAATTTDPDSLTVFSNNELFIFASSTFAPGGEVTLQANATANSYDGTLYLDDDATFTGSGTTTYSIGGRLVLDTNAVFTAASSTVLMTATTTGKSITSTAPITFNNLTFNGVGGAWNLGTDLVILGDMIINNGTVTGTGDISLEAGSLTGNGVLSLGAGTTTIKTTNTLGGTSAWTFYNLKLGNALTVGTTTPVFTATTTVAGVLKINSAHYLDAGNTNWDLSGTGTVFVETGTFIEDTSTVRYSGGGANVLSTQYYNLDVNAGAGSQTYTATGLGIIVDNNLTIGGDSTTVFDLNTNDPALDVNGDMIIRSNGTLSASNAAALTIAGDYDNNGTFTSNNGTTTFDGAVASNIAAGNSSFGSVVINATGDITFSENSTTTSVFNLLAANNFTVNSGQTLAVSGYFYNRLGGAATTWTGSTLNLLGGNNYTINSATTSDSYATIDIDGTTQIRMWNSAATTYNVDTTASLYSQDHAGSNGDLYIWGTYQRNSGSDYWSYATDFDGTSLTGGNERKVDVFLATNASVKILGGSLAVVGNASASTTLQNQGAGTYSFLVGGSASTTLDTYEVRNIDSLGLVFSGTPTVNNLSRGDIEVSQNAGTAITVGGTVITQNPAKTFTNNRFALNGVGSGFNVTATGTTVSSWRFTNHIGDIAGEAFDVDPDGDPGYIVWDNSAANITISGVVYSDDGVTTMGAAVCDGSRNAVRIVVAGLTTYNTSCANGSGAYSVSGISFSPGDSIIAYIIPATTEVGATVTVDPGSNINNFDIYQNRVIARHEGTNGLTIADMAVWDSSDDANIPFTAVDAGTDTLTLPANRKLVVWTAKEFAPTGEVTIAGGGAGAAYDGTLQLLSNAIWTGAGTENLLIGGSIVLDNGATFNASNGTTTFTTTGAARTIDVNESAFYNVAFTGSGSWTMTDSNVTYDSNFIMTNGTLTMPSGTSTFNGSLVNTGGSFDINGGLALFTGASTKVITLNNSDLADVTFAGGNYSFTDTNATTTGSVLINSGTITLPSGNLIVGGDFINLSGAFTHNTADLILTNATAATILASSSDLYGVVFAGGGNYSFTDTNLSLLDSLVIQSGNVTLASGTLSIGGSFDASGGTFANATGTVLFNSSDTGEYIDAGASSFYNVAISAPTGGYSLITSATTTNNFSLSSASSFTAQTGVTLMVGGVFQNLVGGASTTWSGSTLYLNGSNTYELNTKLSGGDLYDTLVVGSNSDISLWNSAATTTTVDLTSSVYSQDNAGVNGALYIFGDYHVGTTTEYWSYATDFDGASLTGSERAVTVQMATNSTTTVDGGSLQIVGTSGNKTIVTNQGAGTYAFNVSAGTINALYYTLRNMNASGLNLSGAPTITSLSYGDYELAVNSGSLISLSSSTLNANASLVITGNSFATTSAITGYNVNLTGTTSNAWTFTIHSGNLDGEVYDVDGGDACGSIRWSDSACLLTQQTQYRWRNDDGGLEVPDSEWFDVNWLARKRVRIENQDATTYTDASVKLLVTYDTDMQADFDDLRFTSTDGVTEIPYWIGSTTNSSIAEVWVKVSSLPAEDTATVFMYYNNPTASTSASSTATFRAADDFDDGNISEYSGQTTLFNADTNFNYNGAYGLDNGGNETGRANLGGIYRTDQVITKGETFRYLQYVDTSAGSGDEVCTLFAVQSAGNNYAVCLEQFGTDRVSLVKNAVDNESSGTILASSTVTFTTGWHEVEVEWNTNDTFNVSVLNPSGATAASFSGTDSSSPYSSGGIGFTYWFHNGGWDAVSARKTLTTEPTVLFGAEQTDGGATWKAAQNTSVSYAINDVARLRIAVENSGLDITNQQFLLEYAALGAAPSCEAVSAGNFISVPVQASCGTSPLCMQSTTYFTNNDATVDLLFDTAGSFVAGEAIENPSNKTNNLNINQNYYTEIEYAVTPTINTVDDTLCLRVTNDGTDLDTYLRIAQLDLRFDPIVTNVTLNAGLDISLVPGTTTTIYATGTVTDLNGFADMVLATSTIYRSGVAGGAACTPDNNNCYVSNSPTLCEFTNCSGNSCTLECRADIYFHADPTDLDSLYEGNHWAAFIEVEDTSAGYGFGSTALPGVDVSTLRAIDVQGAIDYGSIAVNADTGSYNASTTVLNEGNVDVNIEVTGTDLSDGGTSVIPAEQQKFATSTFTYSGCTNCDILSSSTPVAIDVDLGKPTTDTPPTEDNVYWGIAIPFGVNSVAHQGINVFTPVSP